MSNNRSKAAQDKAQEAQKAQAVAAMTATRQAEAAPLPGEKEAPAQADAERMSELEKQLAEVKAAHEAALKELAEAKKAGAADRSEGASPATGQGEYVYVYANLPPGQVFTLPDRGRVEIKERGKAKIFLNPNIATDEIIAYIVEEFRLQHRKVKVIADGSKHYHYAAKEEG